MLRKAICTTGEEAAMIFYHTDRFTRKRALPLTTMRLLHGKGSAQLLDDEAHRRRKQMFMSLMSPEGIHQLAQTRAREVMRYALEEVPEPGNVIALSRAEAPEQLTRLRANNMVQRIGLEYATPDNRGVQGHFGKPSCAASKRRTFQAAD
jgi:cytochrome P450